MVKELKPRDTQTRVKHLILAEYLDAWSGIIVHGLRSHAQKARNLGKPFKIHLVYVDGFAGCGMYGGDHGDLLLQRTDCPVFGSPIIGVQGLDKIKRFAWENYGLHAETNAILVEIDSTSFKTLCQSLKLAGLSDRIKTTARFELLRDGEIAVLNYDFHEVVERALEYTADYTFAFFLLDPRGPKGIPFDIVRPIITRQRTDVMINFPYQDLHKKAGILLGEGMDLRRQALIGNYTRMFGSEEWKGIYRDAYHSSSKIKERRRIVETALVNHYEDVLQSADAELLVKQVGLRFPDRDRTMFYLFLTTHDPTGALKLNEILDQAKVREHALRLQYQDARELARTRQVGQIDFLELVPCFHAEELPGGRHVDIAAIAEILYQRFQGQTVQFRQVAGSMANSPYYFGEIKKALTHLKRTDRAKYKRLSSLNSKIQFPAKGGSI